MNKYKTLNYNNLQAILHNANKHDYILLGESTHGTREFYQIRFVISILLVIYYNFNTIFFEMEWSNGYRLNKYIHGKLDIDVKELLEETFTKFPKWMSCNNIIADLLEFCKCWNNLYENKVYFYGIDCQDIELAKNNICSNPGLNCPIVAEIIENYHEMTNDKNNYWNLRDSFWLKILEKVKSKRDGRFILWAHNSHVGNCAANIRSKPGHINIGYLLEEKYDAYIIGLSTSQGTVRAANNWGSNGIVKNINKPLRNSFEHEISNECNKRKKNALIYISDLEKNQIKNFRYIGVIYDKVNEIQAHYIKTNINKEYDCIIFVNRTSALDLCKIDDSESLDCNLDLYTNYIYFYLHWLNDNSRHDNDHK